SFSFSGLRDGLTLLAELVEQCWDRTYPLPGEDRSRAKILQDVLDDTTGRTRFPITVRLLPVFKGTLDTYSCLHLHPGPQDRLTVGQDDLNKAIESKSLADCETIAEELGQGLEALQTLQGRLAAKLDSAAPRLSNLQEAIQFCQECLKEILKQKRPIPPEE